MAMTNQHIVNMGKYRINAYMNNHRITLILAHMLVVYIGNGVCS